MRIRKFITEKINSLVRRALLIICLLGSYSGSFGQTNLYFEAESGILLGTAKVTGCTNASGGGMVRDIDDGVDNALEIRGISIPEAGSYYITVSYFTLSERSLSYKLNESNATSVALPPSGELWCYQGGMPADFTFQDDFLAGDNILLFFDSPIIDKIVIRSDTSPRQPSAFYVSASSGNDLNDGLAPSTAWQTIDKVNVIPLVPGDSLLFQSGDVFKGKLSVLSEGGEPGLPIVISRYGEGAKPILDGDGHLSTIHILNGGFMHLSDIEIINDGGPAKPGDPEHLRYGLYIENTNADGTIYEHYRFKNLTFKNIYPTIEVTDDDNTGVNAHAIITSGSWGDDVNPTRFKDMLIENCYFTRTARHATSFKAIDSLVIQNNLFEHVGGAGMVIGHNCTNILVEQNITDHTGSKIDPRMAGRGSGIWCFRSTNLTVQHNKFMYARGIHDSYGMHIDIGNRNVVYQYNYSEGNEGGFVEILGANVNVGYRYNLSVGDGWRKRGNRHGQIFWLAGWSGNPSNPIGSDSIFVYNNSIYVRDTIAPGIWIEEVSKNARIYNNIIYVSNDFGPVVIKNQAAMNDFNFNIWYGNIPTSDEDGDLYRGPNAMTSDPGFIAGIVSDPEGFVLQEGSPAIGSGKLIYKEGITPPYDYFHNNGGEDYYGNQVFPDRQPNIGAYNIGGDKLITGIINNDDFDTNSMYPNPLTAGDELTILVPQELISGPISIRVADIAGRSVYEDMKKNVDRTTLDTSGFKKGCYLIRLNGIKRHYTQKLMIR
jgi:hypothetical protein